MAIKNAQRKLIDEFKTIRNTVTTIERTLNNVVKLTSEGNKEH
jgi:hypothetical protein